MNFDIDCRAPPVTGDRLFDQHAAMHSVPAATQVGLHTQSADNLDILQRGIGKVLRRLCVTAGFGQRPLGHKLVGDR